MSKPTNARSTFAATAASVAAFVATQRPARGANDDVRVAIIGLGNKGGHHMGLFEQLDGVRVVSLCDADQAVVNRRAEEFGKPVKKETDLRAVLDDDEVDAVVIATPNHWHALATIWACQAGKDVYVEKPAAYDLWEGRQMIAAARKYDRIVQVGTQRRSDEPLMAGLRELRDGKIGAIRKIHLLHYQHRHGVGRKVIDVPESVNYNLYAGPAPMSPIRRANFHYDWHWFWETGNGELGNNGPHGIDLARFVLDKDALPERVWSLGGRYGWDDYADSPNTQIVFLDYQPAPIIAEIRNLPIEKGVNGAPQYRGLRTGIVVDCEDGYFTGMNGGAFYDHDGNRIETVDGDGGRHHQANFIKAVRSRDRADLTCDIREGHLSGGLCHLGNVSYRLGKQATPMDILESIRDDEGAEDSFTRFAEHLTANGIDINQNPAVLGPALAFNPSDERFTGRSDFVPLANELCRRDYREPFVVPEQV